MANNAVILRQDLFWARHADGANPTDRFDDSDEEQRALTVVRLAAALNDCQALQLDDQRRTSRITTYTVFPATTAVHGEWQY